MLQIPYFKQDTDYSCGAASAQMVLAYYGIRISEKQLMNDLLTEPIYGTHHSALIELFNTHNLYCYTNSNSSLDEMAQHIENSIPCIVHYLEPSGNESHYAVVTAVDKTSVSLHDPWNGADFVLDTEEFISRWKDEESAFPRWYIAVSTKPFSLGRHYKPHPKT